MILYRLVREIAEDEAAEGSRWLEVQADPSGYANQVWQDYRLY